LSLAVFVVDVPFKIYQNFVLKAVPPIEQEICLSSVKEIKINLDQGKNIQYINHSYIFKKRNSKATIQTNARGQSPLRNLTTQTTLCLLYCWVNRGPVLTIAVRNASSMKYMKFYILHIHNLFSEKVNLSKIRLPVSAHCWCFHIQIQSLFFSSTGTEFGTWDCNIILKRKI